MSVLGDVHDTAKNTGEANQKLGEANQNLGTANHNIEQANQNVEKTNHSVEQANRSMGQTNKELAQLHKDMQPIAELAAAAKPVLEAAKPVLEGAGDLSKTIQQVEKGVGGFGSKDGGVPDISHLAESLGGGKNDLGHLTAQITDALKGLDIGKLAGSLHAPDGNCFGAPSPVGAGQGKGSDGLGLH